MVTRSLGTPLLRSVIFRARCSRSFESDGTGFRRQALRGTVLWRVFPPHVPQRRLLCQRPDEAYLHHLGLGRPAVRGGGDLPAGPGGQVRHAGQTRPKPLAHCSKTAAAAPGRSPERCNMPGSPRGREREHVATPTPAATNPYTSATSFPEE